MWYRMLELPGPGLSFSAARVEVARSGLWAHKPVLGVMGPMPKHAIASALLRPARSKHLRASLG